MSTKIYKSDSKTRAIELAVSMVVYACVLLLANRVFKGIYVESFAYALVAAIILSFLNYTIKPILIYLTLPLTIITFGIAYPIVNMVILKLCDLIMGYHFSVYGFIPLFFIAIFISLMKMFLDNLITKRVGG